MKASDRADPAAEVETDDEESPAIEAASGGPAKPSVAGLFAFLRHQRDTAGDREPLAT